jgi:hypothetical protein
MMACDDLAHLGPDVASRLPTIAATRFTGPLAATWGAYSRAIRAPILLSWSALKDWILKQYLGDTWFTSQRLLYSRERFRDSANPHESPAQYIQRRIIRARIFFRYPVNSAEETASVMENAPLPWNHVLRWSERPPIEDVLTLAKQYEDTLVQDWEDSRRQRRRREEKHNKGANLAERARSSLSDKSSLHSPWEDDEGGAFEYSTDEDRRGVVSSAHNANKRPFQRNNRDRPSQPSRDAEKTYPFPRDDSVVSHHKPGKRCFACGSEKHWLRECSHYGPYQTLRENKELPKEHRRYETSQYKSAYAAFVSEQRANKGFQ